MGENEINQVTEEKDLGILIDDKLKFQQHIRIMLLHSELHQVNH
jgi:hypothetical protein